MSFTLQSKSTMCSYASHTGLLQGVLAPEGKLHFVAPLALPLTPPICPVHVTFLTITQTLTHTNTYLH